MVKVIEELKKIRNPKIFCNQVNYIIDKCKTKEKCMNKLFRIITERAREDKPLILTWSPTFIQVIFTIKEEIYNNILYEYQSEWVHLTNMSTKFNGELSSKSNVRHAITLAESC